MFGQGHHEALLAELEQLRRRIQELEAEHARGLRLDSSSSWPEMRCRRRSRAPSDATSIEVERVRSAALLHDIGAVDELMRCAGSQFDPDVTAALIGPVRAPSERARHGLSPPGAASGRLTYRRKRSASGRPAW